VKTCSKCGLEKPDDVFRPYMSHGHRYIHRQCMKCRNAVTLARVRKKRLANPPRRRARNTPSNSRWAPPYYQAWLTELFEAGLPFSEIGRRMSMSKNAIVGRCHRTGLLRKGYKGPTSMQRLDALDAMMDALVPEERRRVKQLSAPAAVVMPPRSHWTMQ
jgi:hypothetical protein